MIKLNEVQERIAIEILLTEYQVCEQKANHFSRVAWMSGSIFFAASFLLLQEGVRLLFQNESNLMQLVSSLILLLVSLFTVLFWFFVIQRRHGFYWKEAYERARAIEEYLGNQISNIDCLESKMINTLIHEKDEACNRLRIHDWLWVYLGLVISVISLNILFVIVKISKYFC